MPDGEAARASPPQHVRPGIEFQDGIGCRHYGSLAGASSSTNDIHATVVESGDREIAPGRQGCQSRQGSVIEELVGGTHSPGELLELLDERRVGGGSAARAADRQ